MRPRSKVPFLAGGHPVDPVPANPGTSLPSPQGNGKELTDIPLKAI